MARRLTFFWGALVMGVLSLWIARPDLFTGESLAETIARISGWSFVAYVAISLFRGVLLMPSTPVVFAGGILFPGSLWYPFPRYGGYDEWLECRWAGADAISAYDNRHRDRRTSSRLSIPPAGLSHGSGPGVLRTLI